MLLEALDHGWTRSLRTKCFVGNAQTYFCAHSLSLRDGRVREGKIIWPCSQSDAKNGTALGRTFLQGAHLLAQKHLDAGKGGKKKKEKKNQRKEQKKEERERERGSETQGPRSGEERLVG